MFRGVIPVQHDYPGRVYLIKKVIENTGDGGNLIDTQIDAQFEYLANVVEVRYGYDLHAARDQRDATEYNDIYSVRDEASIAAYGEETVTAFELNILRFSPRRTG